VFKRIILPLLFLISATPSFATPAVYPDVPSDGYADVSGGSPPCAAGYVTSRSGLGCDKLSNSACDRDHDGFLSVACGGNDCDDTNRFVYPGVSTGGGCTNGYKTCQGNGTLTACISNTVTPLCEAAAGRSCRYIDHVNGSDVTGTGTFANPWKTWLKLVSYYQVADRPTGWVGVQPGDAIYFLGGSYTEGFTYNSHRKLFYLNLTNGDSTHVTKIKAYPGYSPVFDGASWCINSAPQPNGEILTACSTLEMEQCSYYLIDGIEFKNAYAEEGGGMKLSADVNSEIRNNYLHDLHGEANANAGCINTYSGPIGTYIHHNVFGDCYEVPRVGNPLKDGNIVVFGGHDLHISYNTFYNSNDWHSAGSTDSSTGIRYNRTDGVGGYEADHNVFLGMRNFAMSVIAPNSMIHDNLFVNSQLAVWDFALESSFYPTNHQFTFNTTVNTPFIEYIPTPQPPAPVGLTYFTDNVFMDNVAYGGGPGAEVGTAVIGTFLADTVYNEVVGGHTMSWNRNCYYNANYPQLRFDLFAATGAGRDLGALYSFTGWQGQGFDPNSFNENPTFNADWLATSTNCSNKGVRWGASGTSSSTSSGGSSSSASSSSAPPNEPLRFQHFSARRHARHMKR